MILLFIELEKIAAPTEIFQIKFFDLYKNGFWFCVNYIVLNSGKCYYMSFGSNPDKSDLILEDNLEILSAEEYVVLGVSIDWLFKTT